MPNSFSGTFFNRHRIQHESGTFQTDFSEIFYFLPSITDRVEDINRHMGSVNLYRSMCLMILLKLMIRLSLIHLNLTMAVYDLTMKTYVCEDKLQNVRCVTIDKVTTRFFHFVYGITIGSVKGLSTVMICVWTALRGT